MFDPAKPRVESSLPHGGARPGSGRKPKLLTELLISQATAADDIAFAYALFRDTMRDTTADKVLRLDCGREILNRLCGKPAQAVEVSGPDGTAFRVALEWEDGNPDTHADDAALARGAEGGQGTPGAIQGFGMRETVGQN